MKKLLLITIFSLSTLSTCLLHSAEEGEAAESRFIDIGHARLNIVEWKPPAGDGELVLALPGSGGDHSRYKRIGPLIAAGGYHLVVINQRGIKGSTGSLDALRLNDLADDVIAVADSLHVGKFHMVGWAFGNRTSRMLATHYPDRISSLTLIAAGGIVPALTEPGELGRLLGTPDISETEKNRLARRTLFSSASSEALVEDYVQGLEYWPEARRAQQQANRNTPLEEWVAGGIGPILMLMGADDLTAPIENGHIMKEEYGERLELVIVEDAGHVVGLEKPEATASAILGFLARHPTGP